jgi:LemA protein
MSKGLITTLVIIGVLVVIVFGFISWGTGIYDNAIRGQEDVNKEWNDVQAAYQRRADLVPNLVATAKAASENEKEILTQVTQARAGIVGATSPEQLEAAGRKINTAINLAFEAYPQIRSTENWQDLQAQLEGTENRINIARQRYNQAVATYNVYVRGYFKKMALNMFGSDEDFTPRKGFTAAEGSDVAPDVSKELKK